MKSSCAQCGQDWQPGGHDCAKALLEAIRAVRQQEYELRKRLMALPVLGRKPTGKLVLKHDL